MFGRPPPIDIGRSQRERSSSTRRTRRHMDDIAANPEHGHPVRELRSGDVKGKPVSSEDRRLARICQSTHAVDPVRYGRDNPSIRRRTGKIIAEIPFCIVTTIDPTIVSTSGCRPLAICQPRWEGREDDAKRRRSSRRMPVRASPDRRCPRCRRHRSGEPTNRSLKRMRHQTWSPSN